MPILIDIINHFHQILNAHLFYSKLTRILNSDHAYERLKLVESQGILFRLSATCGTLRTASRAAALILLILCVQGLNWPAVVKVGGTPFSIKWLS